MESDEAKRINNQCWETTYTTEEFEWICDTCKSYIEKIGDNDAYLMTLQCVAMETKWNTMKAYVMIHNARAKMGLK